MESRLAGTWTSTRTRSLQDASPGHPALKDGSHVTQAACRGGDWGAGREGRNGQTDRTPKTEQ